MVRAAPSPGDAFVTFGASDCGPGTVDVGVSALCPVGQLYRVSTDSTTAMSQAGAPEVRQGATVLSTGTQVLVWGGQAFTTTALLESIAYADGAVYDPDRDAWAAIASSPVSPPRGGYSAVWTGTEMLVWGGTTGPMLSATGPTATSEFQPASAGAAYNVATATWRALATSGQPSAREGHVAVWTGSVMIVWGGGSYPNPSLSSAVVSDGAAYDPQADAWRPIHPAPEGLLGAVAAWTGSEMLVWGGASGSGVTNHGYRYNVATDAWTVITNVGAPSPRSPTGAVWTGSSFLVWGGNDNEDPPAALSDGAQWFADSGAGADGPPSGCTKAAPWPAAASPRRGFNSSGGERSGVDGTRPILHGVRWPRTSLRVRSQRTECRIGRGPDAGLSAVGSKQSGVDGTRTRAANAPKTSVTTRDLAPEGQVQSPRLETVRDHSRPAETSPWTISESELAAALAAAVTEGRWAIAEVLAAEAMRRRRNAGQGDASS